MTNDELNIDDLARQYFRDLDETFRADTENNMISWLWFTCPANLREEVVAKIESIRVTGVMFTSIGSSWDVLRGSGEE